MQDVQRMQEQAADMVARAEAHLGALESHLRRLEGLRSDAEVELTKFRFLTEGLATAEQVLVQRKKSIQAAGEGVPPMAIPGVEGAIDMMQDLQRQSRENATRAEGRFQAMRQLEEEFRQEVGAATARARGLVIQGQRATVLAERGASGEIQTQTPDATESTPLFEVLDAGAGPDLAKEPIPPRRKSVGKDRLSSRDTER